MATAATNFQDASPPVGWFADLVKQDLAPYPGRASTVARMVISATLVTLIVMIFRIPNAAAGPLLAFMFARDTLVSSVRSTLSVVFTFGAGIVFIPLGARMFAAEPMTHFLWQAASLFAMFFLLHALSDYNAAVTTATVGATAMTIWYLPGPGETNVEHTLWGMFVPAIGVAVCLSVEVVYRAIYKGLDDVLEGITSRLTVMEGLFRSHANNEPVSTETQKMLEQYTVTGAGTLRRRLARTGNDPLYRARMTAVVSLTARSIDLATAITAEHSDFSPQVRQRFSQLAQHVAEIRDSLIHDREPALWEAPAAPPASIRLLPDLERMLALIPQVFQGSDTFGPDIAPREQPPAQQFKILKDDAFRNPEYIRFASYGCLAAMLCYVSYASLAWPGLSTSVMTCLLTALSDIGSSRQKQILRFVGAIIGGFVFAMGSQIFVLPHIDSIAGFTLLFASITAMAAWVATSSPRLSYCGSQIAVAFFLVNLGEFRIHTSLITERDRAIGVLLGAGMMGLVFGISNTKQAAQGMLDVFVLNLRLLSQLIVHPSVKEDPKGLAKLNDLREQIANNFSAVSSAAGVIPFETGATRAQQMIVGEKVKRWQAVLRSFYLMEIPLLQFYHFGERSEVSESVRRTEIQFQQACGAVLTSIADRLEKQLTHVQYDAPRHSDLERLLNSAAADGRPIFSSHDQTLLGLSHNIASLLDQLEEDIYSAPLFTAGHFGPQRPVAVSELRPGQGK
jgi:multidrug resistance protein MdtO